MISFMARLGKPGMFLLMSMYMSCNQCRSNRMGLEQIEISTVLKARQPVWSSGKAFHNIVDIEQVA